MFLLCLILILLHDAQSIDPQQYPSPDNEIYFKDYFDHRQQKFFDNVNRTSKIRKLKIIQAFEVIYPQFFENYAQEGTALNTKMFVCPPNFMHDLIQLTYQNFDESFYFYRATTNLVSKVTTSLLKIQLQSDPTQNEYVQYIDKFGVLSFSQNTKSAIINQKNFIAHSIILNFDPVNPYFVEIIFYQQSMNYSIQDINDKTITYDNAKQFSHLLEIKINGYEEPNLLLGDLVDPDDPQTEFFISYYVSKETYNQHGTKITCARLVWIDNDQAFEATFFNDIAYSEYYHKNFLQTSYYDMGSIVQVKCFTKQVGFYILLLSDSTSIPQEAKAFSIITWIQNSDKQQLFSWNFYLLIFMVIFALFFLLMAFFIETFMNQIQSNVMIQYSMIKIKKVNKLSKKPKGNQEPMNESTATIQSI